MMQKRSENRVNNNITSKKFFLISLIFGIFIFNGKTYSQTSDRSTLIASCNELTQILKSSNNCSDMTNSEIKELIISLKDKVREKNAQEAYINLTNEYNKAVSFENYANICEKIKKVFPDNKQCKELLPNYCWEVSMEVLSAGVKNCFAGLNSKTFDSDYCRHEDIPLLKAVCDQDTAKVKVALDNGDINTTNSNGENALHLAIKRNNSSLFNLLLEKNINIETSDENGNKPLHLAAQKNNYAMVKKLLEKGADTDAKNDKVEWAVDLTTDKEIVNLISEYMKKN